MKAIFHVLFISLLAYTTAHADWVVVQKSTTEGQASESTLQIKGDHTRMDQGKEMSVIADGAKGTSVMLMHAQKAMVKMDAESIKKLMAQAGGALGGNQPAAAPTATGQKEKVGEYDCEIYTWTGALGTGKFWIAKDFPNYKDLNTAQDNLMNAMGNPAAALVPKNSDFPGMAVKSELQIMGKTVTSELVSAKQEPVDEAVFVIPTDYQEMKVPGR